MAKGLAVISGSNAVVFKALENGIVSMGGSGSWGTTTATVTISGSLTLSGSEGVFLHASGSDFIINNGSGQGDKFVLGGISNTASVFGQQPAVGNNAKRNINYELKRGLKWAATSSVPEGSIEDKLDSDYYSQLELENKFLAPEDFLVITESGEVRRVNKIDASVVVLNDGQTVEQQVGGLNLNLKHSSSDGSIDVKDVNLTKGDLVLKDKQYRTVLSMSNKDSEESVEVLVDLDPDLRVESLSASAGLNVTGSSKLLGELHVVSGSGHTGNATIDGTLTVKGNLDIVGDVNQITVNKSNLNIEDAIVLIGSGSDGTQGELGFVFGTEGVSSSAFTLKNGDFYLGKTTDKGQDASGYDLDPDNDGLGKLILANLSASATIDALDLQVANSATIHGDLVANSDVTLGDNEQDVISIKGQLTASNGMHISTGSLDLDGELDVRDATLLRDTLTVKGTATFDSTVDMTGSLTVVQSASIGGDLDVLQSASIDGDLLVKGDTTLGDVLGEDNLLIKANLTASSVSRFKADITVSDSADVVLENGSSITLNQGDITLSSGAATVTGSLTLTGSAEDPLTVKGLTHHDTASVTAHDILVIDGDGAVSQASMVSASQIAVVPDGDQLTSSNAQTAFYEIQNHINSLSLRIGTGSNFAEASTLENGGIIFTHDEEAGEDSNILLSVTNVVGENDATLIKVNFDLNHNLSASSLSASQYVVADKLTASNGLEVKAGGYNVTGDSQLSGDLTIIGDLLVQGTTIFENRNVTSSNLIVEDRIIVVGSGSDPSQTQVGFQIGSREDDGKVYAIGTQPLEEADTLFIGYTVDSNDHLNNAFSSSIEVENFKLKTGKLELANSALINETLTVYSTSSLHNDLIVHGTGTFKDDLYVDVNTILRGQLDVTGAVLFANNLHVSGSGSIDGDLTIGGKTELLGNISISGAVDLSSSLNVDGVVTLGSSLEVDGAVLLNSTLSVTGAADFKSAVTLGNGTGVHYQGLDGKYDTDEDQDNIIRSKQAIDDHLVKVNGPMRAPIFSNSSDGEYPRVPLAWCVAEVQLEYVGYMFYLKGDAIPNSPFTQGDKWYFNEKGFWHSSFFWEEE